MINKLFLAVLGALTISGAGVVAGNAEWILPEGDSTLSFDSNVNEFECTANTNGWFNNNFSVSDRIITLDFTRIDTFGYNNPGVMDMLAGRSYTVEFKLKSSNTDGIVFWQATTEWSVVEVFAPTTEWASYSFTFNSLYDHNNIIFQQSPNTAIVEIKEMYIFEESRTVSYGNAVGVLPQLPVGASSWGIDGVAISDATNCDWSGNKVASPIYPSSLVNAFTLDGANLAKSISGQKNMESVTAEGNEIHMIAKNPGEAYWSNGYQVTAGKTYYLIGKYKTSQDSGLTIAINDPWKTLVDGGGHRQYTPFFGTFTATSTRLVQILFQCAYNLTTSGNCYLDVIDIYFGEAIEVNYGSAFSNLPEPTGEYDSWKINDELITTETINTYATNENIVASATNPYFNVLFPLKSFVGGSEINLNLPYVGDTDYRIINVEAGHTYFVSFEYKTDELSGIKPFISKVAEGATWVNVGYEGVTSPGVFTLLEYKFTSDFTGEMQLIIQNAYDNNGGTADYFVKNYVACELLRLRNGDMFGTLPTLPTSEDPLLVAYAWSIDGENEVKPTSVFSGNSDTYMSVLYDLPHFTLYFEAEGTEINPLEVKYSEKIGNLPACPAASAGHHYVWVIGEDEITSETVYLYTEDVTATLKLITNVYNVVFKVENVTLETREIEYGAAIGSFPSYSPDEKYDYHWEIDGETVTTETLFDYESNKDCVLVKTLKVHTATLVADGETVGTASFNLDGYLEELPAVPEKPGYNGVWDNVKLINADMTVNAIYTPKTFNIYFLDMNGNRLAMYKITYGQNLYEAVTAWPEAPAVEGYTFVSFQYNGEEIKITDKYEFTEDIALTAVYEKNAEEPKKDKGCKGSIVTSSAIISVLAIAGTGLLISKRKEDK